MNCKHCGEENLIGSSICKNCGQNPNGNIDDNDSLNKTIDPNKVIINNALQGDNKSLTQTSQQEIETIDSANKRICNNCNNPINKEDHYCIECGNKVNGYINKEDNRIANILSLISLILVVMIFFTGSIFLYFVSLMLTIYVRVKYKNNVFSKVIVGVLIALFLVFIIIFISAVRSCGHSLSSCSG